MKPCVISKVCEHPPLLIKFFNKHLTTAGDSANHFFSDLSLECKHLAIGTGPGSDVRARYQLKQCELWPKLVLKKNEKMQKFPASWRNASGLNCKFKKTKKTTPVSPGGPTLPGLPGVPFCPISPGSPLKDKK